MLDSDTAMLGDVSKITLHTWVFGMHTPVLSATVKPEACHALIYQTTTFVIFVFWGVDGRDVLCNNILLRGYPVRLTGR